MRFNPLFVKFMKGNINTNSHLLSFLFGIVDIFLRVFIPCVYAIPADALVTQGGQGVNNHGIDLVFSEFYFSTQ